MHLNILITPECNLKCEYCDIKTNFKSQINDDILFKNFKTIIDDIKPDIITITGGEPSLVNLEILQKMIDYSNCVTTITTNGTNSNIFNLKNVNFLVHIISLDNIIQIPEGSSYTYILTNKNEDLSNLKKLDRPVFLSPYNNKVSTRFSVDYDMILKSYEKLGLDHNFLNNIRYLKNRPKLFDKIRFKCFKESRYPQIDIQKMEILQCCVSYTNAVRIPYSLENFRKRSEIFESKKLPEYCSGCSYVIRNLGLLDILKADKCSI